ncbi:MAG: helix-turn-helix domain-containing protein [Alphaproteobacteria bacterium]|jgi:DNA-binding MarR family transcriptional regulator|nr:helix-turn-helix domain-containing protein [Alphaproteobacteria bacterium]|tara:strand:+ start:1281 stop:1697 length:417 start_codon:yes stop_codon:yes gene_type:complete
MNLSFADTLYFKKENILEIILGLHRSYKSLQREIQTCCEIYQLTFNELLVLLEIRKGFNKKVDIANRIYIKKQNLNLIIKDLKEKDIIKNDGKKVVITNHGNDLIEKTIKRINEKIIKIFQKTDPKNMAGFINIIESL